MSTTRAEPADENTTQKQPDDEQTMQAEPDRKAGRPKGAKRRQQPTAEQLGAACPQCRSTKHEVVRKLPTQSIAGFHHGQPFTSIERRRVRCRDCAQHFIRSERKFDPKQWNGPKPDAGKRGDA